MCESLTTTTTVGSVVSTTNVNKCPLFKLCFALFRSALSLEFNSELYCCYCSIISNLDTFRIRFKMSQSLTASSFFHLFAFLLFEIFSTHNRHHLSTITSFLHDLRLVFFCQIISELKFYCKAMHPTGYATDQRVLIFTAVH